MNRVPVETIVGPVRGELIGRQERDPRRRGRTHRPCTTRWSRGPSRSRLTARRPPAGLVRLHQQHSASSLCAGSERSPFISDRGRHASLVEKSSSRPDTSRPPTSPSEKEARRRERFMNSWEVDVLSAWTPLRNVHHPGRQDVGVDPTDRTGNRGPRTRRPRARDGEGDARIAFAPRRTCSPSRRAR